MQGIFYLLQASEFSLRIVVASAASGQVLGRCPACYIVRAMCSVYARRTRKRRTLSPAYNKLYTWLKYELSVNEVAPPFDDQAGLTMFMPVPSPFQAQPSTVQPLLLA